MPCRHCQYARVSRPRGLCWTCYYDVAIRDLYPSASKFGRRGAGAAVRRAKPALDPTDARPGTAEKIVVLMRRAELGQELWHPGDATWAGPRVFQQAG